MVYITFHFIKLLHYQSTLLTLVSWLYNSMEKYFCSLLLQPRQRPFVGSKIRIYAASRKQTTPRISLTGSGGRAVPHPRKPDPPLTTPVRPIMVNLWRTELWADILEFVLLNCVFVKALVSLVKVNLWKAEFWSDSLSLFKINAFFSRTLPD